MSTHSITHRPTPIAAVVAAVVAAAAFAFVTVSHDAAGSGPDTHPPKVVGHAGQPTTAGGRTQIGIV
jgi:hypothetical protein